MAGARKRYALNLLPDLEHALAVTEARKKLQVKLDKRKEERENHADYLAHHPDAPDAFDLPTEKRPEIDRVLASTVRSAEQSPASGCESEGTASAHMELWHPGPRRTP